MIKEFQKFIMRGNVIDLAVGLIIGAAFSGIITSLVNDIIMPPIGLALGGVDFSNIFILLREGTTPAPYASLAAAREAGAVVIAVGAFLNLVINFLIVAFAVFLLVKAVNAMQDRFAKKEAPPAPAGPTTEERLVTVLEKLEKKV
ncbi:MAG: large conductance mechanosensitive channel protein MscL [Chloroflexota bacterium]|nr:large conductance mechanosensitive channel protein MscL [Chloroflexota bacterium]